jgi:hypothetical protein
VKKRDSITLGQAVLLIVSFLKGTCIYFRMASQYQPIWSSNMNCQKFARLFLMEGLGLLWPEDISVAGDILPVTIDISIFFMSSSNKIKKKKAKRD